MGTTKLFFKAALVFSMLIIWSCFVIGLAPGAFAKNFNIPIYIQTSAGIERAGSDEIIDILFNYDFEIQRKIEQSPMEKCSLRAEAGSLEIGGKIFENRNKLSFNIPLKNDDLIKMDYLQ